MFRLFGVILFIAFSLPFFPVLAQIPVNSSSEKDSSTYFISDRPELDPEFPGGEQALLQYLAEKTANIDLILKPEGRVILRFTVTKTGKLQNISVLKSSDTELDQIAINIVKEMPIWSPGLLNGKVADVKYILPIRFKKDAGNEKRKLKSKN